MKKWCKAVLFILPLMCMVAAVNWYVDSYAYLRVTYDQIGEQMVGGSMNVMGLQESDFNDRSLLLACLKQQEEAKELIVAGSSRVMNFDHTMFDTDSFYNTALSESTIYDLLAVAGILDQAGCLPERMIIGVDAFLFNASHNNDRWKELEDYAVYMERKIEGLEDRGDESATEDLSGDTAYVKEETGQAMVQKEQQEKIAGITGTDIHSQPGTGRNNNKWLSLDYFRYNVTCLPSHKRFAVTYTQDWEAEQYLKHYDGSIAYQKSLRDVDVSEVEELTRQSMEEHVVYRLTDYDEMDEESVALLNGLIDYLQAQGVEVMLYLPPYSPMMYNYIESEEQFHVTFQVEERIRQMAADRGVALYGSYDPAGCGLEMTDLYDIYHVKTEKIPDTFYPTAP
ncbi:MAG: hypothetical protein HDR04_01190 [Lachnospiraceae bacterium]|nr:hypothetical protein [Lachnospiraceae bacterium]